MIGFSYEDFRSCSAQIVAECAGRCVTFTHKLRTSLKDKMNLEQNGFIQTPKTTYLYYQNPLSLLWQITEFLPTSPPQTHTQHVEGNAANKSEAWLLKQ